jgi:hypothetical protein
MRFCDISVRSMVENLGQRLVDDSVGSEELIIIRPYRFADESKSEIDRESVIHFYRMIVYFYSNATSIFIPSGGNNKDNSYKSSRYHSVRYLISIFSEYFLLICNYFYEFAYVFETVESISSVDTFLFLIDRFEDQYFREV